MRSAENVNLELNNNNISEICSNYKDMVAHLYQNKPLSSASEKVKNFLGLINKLAKDNGLSVERVQHAIDADVKSPNRVFKISRELRALLILIDHRTGGSYTSVLSVLLDIIQKTYDNCYPKSPDEIIGGETYDQFMRYAMESMIMQFIFADEPELINKYIPKISVSMFNEEKAKEDIFVPLFKKLMYHAQASYEISTEKREHWNDVIHKLNAYHSKRIEAYEENNDIMHEVCLSYVRIYAAKYQAPIISDSINEKIKNGYTALDIVLEMLDTNESFIAINSAKFFTIRGVGLNRYKDAAFNKLTNGDRIISDIFTTIAMVFYKTRFFYNSALIQLVMKLAVNENKQCEFLQNVTKETSGLHILSSMRQALLQCDKSFSDESSWGVLCTHIDTAIFIDALDRDDFDACYALIADDKFALNHYYEDYLCMNDGSLVKPIEYVLNNTRCEPKIACWLLDKGVEFNMREYVAKHSHLANQLNNLKHTPEDTSILKLWAYAVVQRKQGTSATGLFSAFSSATREQQTARDGLSALLLIPFEKCDHEELAKLLRQALSGDKEHRVWKKVCTALDLKYPELAQGAAVGKEIEMTNELYLPSNGKSSSTSNNNNNSGDKKSREMDML